jgi:hypothetical protein
MTNTTQLTEEKLDLFYQPLQDKLKQRYAWYSQDGGSGDYYNWLKDELTFIDIQIKELQ